VSATGSGIPTAILMSGSGTNARKLLEYSVPNRGQVNYQVRLIISDNPDSNYRKIAEEHGVEAQLHDIYTFCGVPHPQEGLTGEQRGKLKDPLKRDHYDRGMQRILDRHGVQLLALAGYDWVIAPFLCQSYVVLNVHPGDLRVRDSQNRRCYIGLGWIPTAKAILAGERFVHSTTHLVTAELDGGPLARVSQGVPVDLPDGVTPANILPEGIRLGDVIRGVRRGDNPELAEGLLVTHSKMLQNRLKELGDWIIFPQSLDQIAALMRSGRIVRHGEGTLLLDGQPVADLFLQGEEE
jgi:folate-dependent phosphoribosylglycinamide formyltransferase PurN